MKILLIDDDSEDYEIFSEALTVLSPLYNCISAKNGREAIALLQQETELPDLIFLDINMPVMNGRDCLVAIKGDSRLSEIPVIMYSTTADTQEIKQYYQLGAYDFLIKPAVFRALIDSLESIINLRLRTLQAEQVYLR